MKKIVEVIDVGSKKSKVRFAGELCTRVISTNHMLERLETQDKLARIKDDDYRFRYELDRYEEPKNKAVIVDITTIEW